jgi:integrase/recombinase XerD
MDLNLQDFRECCLIDLQLAESTTERHVNRIRKLLKKGELKEYTKQDLRTHLMKVKEKMSASAYKNELASLKKFFGDYLGMPHLVDSFKYPRQGFRPISVPSKTELKAFYKTLESLRDKAAFLMFASSGLRHSEMLSLDRFQDIDLENRMLMPRKEPNKSKHCWLSFYNAEAESDLRKYLRNRKDKEPRLFPISKRHVLRIFKKATEATGIKITPQLLRDWFCSEMGSLGVPDRYVDAFCGRVPKSVLARHYTDFSPEKLKRIYDKAGLKLLS